MNFCLDPNCRFNVHYNSIKHICYKNVNGDIHAEDKPAVIFEYKKGHQMSQRKYWYRNGKLHREDGPALQTLTINEYWLDGIAIR